jgi:hypothetical protein
MSQALNSHAADQKFKTQITSVKLSAFIDHSNDETMLIGDK